MLLNKTPKLINFRLQRMSRNSYINFLNKVFYTFFISTLIIVSCSISGFSQSLSKNQITTVVIDAGHGGKDPGAHGKRAKEKDVVLAIALKLGKYISENLPDVKVIYTRKTDVFIPLYERASIANKNQADLFISIHANANPNPVADGTETYTMGPSKNQDNINVAKAENAVILKEDNYTDQYGGYDPNSAESFIIFSLLQNTYAEQSIDFASYVQSQFEERANRNNRGVKQAGFLVLWKTTMPSVLIETGFITNPAEEKYLTSDSGQDYIASAIFRAFRDYKHDIENHSVYAQKQLKTDTILPRTAKDTGNSVTTNTDTSSPAINNSVNQLPAANGIQFLVQITSSKNAIPLQSDYFKGLKNVEEFHTETSYKYAVGRKSSYNDIVEYSKIIKNYFPDAFIIAMRDGKIIPLKDALKEIKD